MNDQEFASHQRILLRRPHCWKFVYYTIVFSVFQHKFFTNKNDKLSVALREMETLNPQIFKYVEMTMILYMVQIVYEAFWVLCISHNSQKTQTRLSSLVFIAEVVITSYGIHFAWTREFSSLEGYPNSIEFKSAILALILLRFIPICFVAFLFLLCCLFICLHLRSGQVERNQHLKRVPVVNAFIQSKAREPTAKEKKEACSICLVEFNEGDGKTVAELRCKHIFHVECLKEWVKKNDICPMCRERINPE